MGQAIVENALLNQINYRVVMGDLQTAPPKLKDGINKKLLNLSSSLPDDLEELYVSIPELKQRLIFGGVDPSLLTHILNYDGTSQQWDVADSSE